MPDHDIAVSVRDLSKSYTIAHENEKHTLATEALLHSLKNIGKKPTSETFWALRDVSFDINKGDVVGIIGRNGAGKSTLLKILSRITEPTSGQIDLYGRVGSLLEVGTGFHPELTGRENTYLNGAILGMSKREIAGHFDAIVDFAGVEKFLDTPVKRYSSGMYVRLAFAVAAHLEPEILIVDEVLAVGDAEFQKKCLGKMQDVASHGRTVIFVSHNMAAMQNLCSRIILLSAGSVVHQGPTSEVVNYYLNDILAKGESDVPLAERTDRTGNGKIRLTSFHIEDSSGSRLDAVSSGMNIDFVFGYRAGHGVRPRSIDVGLSISSNDGQLLFVIYSSYMGDLLESSSETGSFRCSIEKLPLSSGQYRIGARVMMGGEEADWVRNDIALLNVETGDYYGSGSAGFNTGTAFLVNGKWRVQEELAPAGATYSRELPC